MIDRSTVHYYCPCYKSPVDLPQQKAPLEEADEKTKEAGEEDSHISLSDSRLSHALFALEDLYFCYDCHTHRCPRCVTEELVSLFCPSCLVEVPSKTNATERHCPRNCFRCPECQSSLQTIGDEAGGFTLNCPFCHWSSASSGLRFAKATSLALQIQAHRPNTLKSRFVQVEKHHLKAQQGQQADLTALRYYKQYKQAMGITQDAEAAYQPPLLISEDATDLLDQPVSSPAVTRASLPLHTPLRAKRTKRCRQCRLLLVKPDPKPSSLHFRSRLYARNVLPDLNFGPCAVPDLTAGVTSRWSLRVTNPLPVKIDVTLSSQRKTAGGDYIVIVTPDIAIGPNSEEWEEGSVVPTKSTSGELLDAGKNWASVLIQMTPTSHTRPVHQSNLANQASLADSGSEAVPGQVKVAFAVFVQMKWEDEDERDDQGERTKSGKVKKELGFWAVLDTAYATRKSTI